MLTTKFVVEPKSLTYFENAEPEFDPISLNNTNWEQVKSTIENRVTEYM